MTDSQEDRRDGVPHSPPLHGIHLHPPANSHRAPPSPLLPPLPTPSPSARGSNTHSSKASTDTSTHLPTHTPAADLPALVRQLRKVAQLVVGQPPRRRLLVLEPTEIKVFIAHGGGKQALVRANVPGDQVPEARHGQITCDGTEVFRLLEAGGVGQVSRRKRDLVPGTRVRPADPRGSGAQGIAAHVGPGGG